MVSKLRNHHVPLVVDSNPPRISQLPLPIPQNTEFFQKFSFFIQNLYPVVIEVHYNQITNPIDCHTRGIVKLSITTTQGTKFPQEPTNLIKNLYAIIVRIRNNDFPTTTTATTTNNHTEGMMKLSIPRTFRTKLQQKFSFPGENLYAVVVGISNHKISATICNHTMWMLKLTITITLLTKCREKFAFLVKHLNTVVESISNNQITTATITTTTSVTTTINCQTIWFVEEPQRHPL
eukprot:TRINITY_DN2928_c0_g4_i2.p1 TRINITY_DN2928_c0_g4~~TRINITY_DN2928_c0_g4_i2.p1  ORF type:complete len:235 (+),score=53.83 TRINITY_DN2928_c0_g4_i2:319-1023(+)